MRKPRKVRSRTQRRSSESLITAELLERRYALTATPFSDEFASAAMEAVARGEITSDRWIVHEINNLGCSNNQAFHNLSSFGGNAGWHADPIGNSFFRLRTSGISTSDVVNWARNNQDNFLFEPDLPIQVETSSNDPSLWRLYGLNNYGQAGGAPDADIDATDAWDITTGSRDVVIGVIDSGVDITHPDLAANIWVNPGETPNNGVDDDGNGFIDDVNGWDFYDDDNSPNDGNGHGTHVAGTIGAVGNNNLGIVGVNWQVSLLPLRFLGNDGSGWTSDAVAAVNYATMLKRDFDINVAATNNSWGGGGYSRTLDRAIQAANDEGIMFIAAAGNQGTNNDANPSYPTNYSSPNVISVAALNRSDNLASFSNYGATTVDVGAPGVSIYSTLPGNSYGFFSGTSMAAPHVAGVVGLLNAAKPGISVTEVNNAILNTVDPLQSLNGKTLTGGRVNAASALTSLLGQLPTIEPIDDLIVSNTQTVNVPVNASDIDGDVILSLVVSESTSGAAPAAVTLDGSTLTITPIEGRHGITTVSVTATDADSNTAAISFTIDTLQAIESEGAVTLNKDSFGKFYADDTPIYNSAGSHIGEDTAFIQAEWDIGGVETVNGTNRMLVYRSGDAHYWNLDSTWQ
ncbi:MAG: S8 family serine peptidase, partial [Pirellulales bacterium]